MSLRQELSTALTWLVFLHHLGFGSFYSVSITYVFFPSRILTGQRVSAKTQRFLKRKITDVGPPPCPAWRPLAVVCLPVGSPLCPAWGPLAIVCLPYFVSVSFPPWSQFETGSHSITLDCLKIKILLPQSVRYKELQACVATLHLIGHCYFNMVAPYTKQIRGAAFQEVSIFPSCFDSHGKYLFFSN